jgi:NADH dehydrogenase FAD-containing subunit
VEFAAELHDFLKDDVAHIYPKLPINQIRITLFDVLPHVLGA